MGDVCEYGFRCTVRLVPNLSSVLEVPLDTREGVQLLGGMNADFSSRDPWVNPSYVVGGPGEVVLMAQDIKNLTTTFN